jgi:hypothetical protein
MNGKIFVGSLLLFTICFSAVLYYFQVFAFYKRVDFLPSITVLGKDISIEKYQGIDSATSGLKLRGCFTIDPKELLGTPKPFKATPLSSPFWFRCFDNRQLQIAIDSGEAKAYLVAENEKDGIDRIVAVYSDGKAFQWRQLNSKFLD